MLEVDNVSKSFGKLQAVKGVSLSVGERQIRGLIGPNGSGKTTTFNLISGFLKPSSGVVSFKGRSITGIAPHRVASLGLVRTFQLTSVYKDMTVLENIELGHHLTRGRERSISASVAKIVDFMELGNYRQTPAKLLPAGTQRMLSVATSLAAGPKVLMLDEPLAGLNPSEKSRVVEKIRQLRDSGISILIVEHDLKSIMSLCDEITVIQFGLPIASGSPSEVTSNPKVIEAYIGPAGTHYA